MEEIEKRKFGPLVKLPVLRDTYGASVEDVIMSPQESPAWIQPEKELLTEMLRRAYEDLFISHERVAAIEWLREPATDEDEFSFPWVCSNLGLELGKMRMLFERSINGIRNTFTTI